MNFARTIFFAIKENYYENKGEIKQNVTFKCLLTGPGEHSCICGKCCIKPFDAPQGAMC